MSSIQADFDRLAQLDSDSWTPNNHYHNLLLRQVPQNCVNALELGCGTGAFSRRLAKLSQHVLALDLSPEMIRVARTRSTQFTNIDFQLGDAISWDYPSAHFDCISSIATLHHLQQRELLERVKEALTPGGVLIVLDLVTSQRVGEVILDLAGLGVSSVLRLIHNGRLRPSLEVQAAWEQHGKHDSYATLDEIRALSTEILPGAIIRRHLLWRYSLVFQKP